MSLEKKPSPAMVPSREQLVSQASKFLDAEEIRDAPVEKKREFLIAKGLSNEDIDSIFKLREKDQDSLPSLPEQEEIKPAQAFVGTSSGLDHTPIPPIVTYPEFLAPPPAPPAPVDAHNLISGLYLAGGVAATIFGASKFYFQPMYDSLTAARLDLHATALSNLTTFNEKLSALVPNKRNSVRRPSSAAHTRRRYSSAADEDEDIIDDDLDNASETSSSADSSEPTELFHMDVATQTSPPPSVISPEDAEDSPEAKLEKISNHLSTLVTSNSDGTDNELVFELESLSTYLDSLRYDRFGSSTIGDFYSPYAAFPWGTAPHNKDNPIAKVKAEIRSVKGVFLNTKNFPSAGLR